MLRRLTALFIAGLLSLTLASSAWAHWADAALNGAAQAGWLPGYDSRTFGPDTASTRAEFAALLARAMGLTPVRYQNHFSDVRASDKDANMIAAAAEAGLIQGVGGGRFAPNEKVERYQVAVMLSRALGLREPRSLRTPFTDDHLIPDWARKEVAQVSELGYFGGYPDGSFSGYRSITRAETVVVVWRVFGENAPTRLLPTAFVLGDDISLAFTSQLETGSAHRPLPRDFTVTVGSRTRAVDSVTVAGSTVTLHMASEIASGAKVTVEYTPGSRPLAIRNGRTLLGFTVTAKNDDREAPTWPADAKLSQSNVSNTALTLSWPAAKDNVAVTGYRIYQDNRLLDEVSASTRSYRVTGLRRGSTYNFRVEAGDAAGNWSKDGPRGRFPAEPPYWPKGSDLYYEVASDGAVVLLWDDADDRVGITNYRIYQDGKLIATVKGTVNSYRVKGLGRGTYTFRVEAGNGAGLWTTDGPSVKVTLGAVDWPSGAALTFTDIGNGGVTLNWPRANNAVSYRIYQDGKLVTDKLKSTDRSYRIEGLRSDRSYTFRVDAIASGGAFVSLSSTLKAQDLTAPTWGSGAALTITREGSGYLVSWPAASDNKGVTGYQVYLDGSLRATTVDRQYFLSNVSAGDHEVTIVAVDAAGNRSEGLKGFITDDTEAPYWSGDHGLRAVGGTTSSLSFTWNPARDNRGVAGYRLTARRGSFSKTVTVTTTSATIDGLKAGTEYEITLVAYDRAGNESAEQGPIYEWTF